ncbi:MULTISPECIES: iron ABC transporter permease [Trueperella]|uniref:ABC transporter permease n=1 Tax=Trueperella TaxID=1069494 RepID=UPI0008A11D12|nr:MULTISPECIES: iron ABC transporter permease [Trueperella]OFS66115.1 iron ABC transporter permease [Trueperella sp. HMSC08H06]
MRGRVAHLGWGAALAVPALFLILFFLWPVGRMLSMGLGDAAMFGEVLGQGRTWRIVGQTLGMALAATAISVVLGVPGAYVLYRLKIPGARVARAFATAPFALPTVVVGVAFRALLDDAGPLGFLGLGQTTAAVVAAMVFFNYAVVVRTVGSMWAGIADLTDAARTLGASPARAFFTVTLPQLGPSIAAGGGLVFLFCSTSFGIVQTLGRPGYGTLESEIYVQSTAYLDLGHAAVLSVLQLVIVVVALIVSTALSARTERALDVTQRPAKRPTRAAIPAIVVTAAVLVFLAAPLLGLLAGSLRSQGQWSLHNYRVLAQPGAGFAGGTSILDALDHSVKIALDAATLSLVVGVILAFALSRRPRTRLVRTGQRVLDGVVLLPLGISAVTVGFGFLVTWGRVQSVPTGLIVPLAQAVVALPLVVRSLVPILRAIDPRMREAAATLGASPARVLATIDLPIMARGLGIAFGFAFAISLGEFGATSFLASPDYQTLPVLISKLLGRPGVDNYGMALAGSVILAGLTGVIMFVTDLVRPSGTRGAF